MANTPPPPPPGTPPPPPPPRGPAGAPFPPPPPVRANEVEEKAPPVAWLVPLAAVLGVIGVFTPWFKPQATLSGGGRTVTRDAVDDALYSWKEGRLGLIAPIVLVIVAIGVVGLLMGRNSRFHRSSTSPVVSAARGALIGGAIAIASVLIAYFLLPSQYKFTTGATDLSWDDAKSYIAQQTGASSVELSQGPQLGLWLTAAGGALAVVAGVLMLLMRKKPSDNEVPAPATGYGPPPSAPPAGYQQQPPAGFQQQPPAGYQPPPPGYQQQPPPRA